MSDLTIEIKPHNIIEIIKGDLAGGEIVNLVMGFNEQWLVLEILRLDDSLKSLEIVWFFTEHVCIRHDERADRTFPGMTFPNDIWQHLQLILEERGFVYDEANTDFYVPDSLSWKLPGDGD